MSYPRVLPRDLFNESKLLKCMGQLSLLIHDEMTPVKMTLLHDGEPFHIILLDEGSLMITNIKITIAGFEIQFKSTYNSRDNYPLIAVDDYDEYTVFTESGTWNSEFIQLCASLYNEYATG